jgi:hypothetical protein
MMVRKLRTAIWGLVLAAVAVGGPTAARHVSSETSSIPTTETGPATSTACARGATCSGSPSATCIEYAIHRVGVRYGLKTLWVMARSLGWRVGVARPAIVRR